MTKEEQPLSRSAYRKQQEQQAAPVKETMRRENKQHGGRQPKRRHHDLDTAAENAASPQLKKRLNWAIGIVAVLIVLVYLVLFFV